MLSVHIANKPAIDAAGVDVEPAAVAEGSAIQAGGATDVETAVLEKPLIEAAGVAVEPAAVAEGSAIQGGRATDVETAIAEDAQDAFNKESIPHGQDVVRKKPVWRPSCVLVDNSQAEISGIK